MKVVHCEEIEKDGNDCLIKTLYSIIEVFGQYQVMKITRYEGSWTPGQPTMCIDWAKTEEEAYQRLDELKERFA